MLIPELKSIFRRFRLLIPIIFPLLFLFSLILIFSCPSPVYSLSQDKIEYKKPFILPLEGDVVVDFRESYLNEEKSKFYKHTGIDISGSPGARVMASGNGVVSYTGFSPIGGRTIVISHNQKIRTTYLNLSGIYVVKGDIVRQGDIVAFIGAVDDPSSREYHLHFGVIYGNKYLDPLQLLRIDYSSISRFIRLGFTPGDFYLE